MAKITHTYAYITMVSGILSFAGCSLWGPEPKGEAQFEPTLESQSKALAGAYSDIGSNGSIKPHPYPVHQPTEKPQSQTGNAIILGGPLPVPDLNTGQTDVKGSPGGTTPSPGSVSGNKGSLSKGGAK